MKIKKILVEEGRNLIISKYDGEHLLVKQISNDFKNEIEEGLIEGFIFYARTSFFSFKKLFFCFCFSSLENREELEMALDESVNRYSELQDNGNLYIIKLSGQVPNELDFIRTLENNLIPFSASVPQ
ncbi:MAG: hypothetical protein M3Q58_09165 [Bacteroidota bacterium]|nr:hypothetical protein [Bacteroidota bacterium]